MKFSISVVCYESSLIELQSLMNSIVDSIKHLRSQYDLSKIEIFIIDNSDKGTISSKLCRLEKRRLKNLKVDLCRIAGHGNIGYGRAHNLALQEWNL